MLDASDYEIVIDGQLGTDLQRAFEPLLVTVAAESTTIHGRHLDQAALRGVLDRVANLGLDLRDVHRLAPPR